MSEEKSIKFPSMNPAVSVISPMYNVEKYVSEFLDSLLAQSFQDFEVIVVDACSTDNSVDIIKSYIPKFDGRLKLAKAKNNTGDLGEPSNLGLALSRGEYLFILDNDNTITPDALEKLYSVAKEFKADVVACEKYYRVPEENWNNVNFRKNLKPYSNQRGGFVNEPTLITFDVAKRVQDCSGYKFLFPMWTKLIRRDYLMENQIHFQDILIQDMLTTSCLLYTAKRFVRVPYVINYYRVRKDSLYNQEREPLEQMKTYMNSLKVGFKCLNNFLNGIEFFQKNPEVKYAALKTYFFENWNMYVSKVYDKIPLYEREESLREEFGNIDNTPLLTLLFDVLFKTEKETAELNVLPIPSNFALFVTARIDIQLLSTSGDFQLLYVSDKKANVAKPAWLQKNGIGYQIQSYAGKLSINAKATVNGNLRLWLRGIDVRDSKDKSKRSPYWIDYTKLVVNDKTIFDTITPAWHDEIYAHNTEVKAGEEIKIQIDWQPHRSDT
ncbi:MAG: glycosyltransferase family 2 protein [Quinella sp. 1Q5]|nr:glycosyltransferase family 2 protein [Quinella sp. 1Q5]